MKYFALINYIIFSNRMEYDHGIRIIRGDDK